VSFGAKTSADTVLSDLDVRGRRVFMTGGTAGIGFATAQALVKAGVDVWIGARSRTRGEQAVAKIETAASAGTSPGRCHVVELDLASVASVRTCTETLDVDSLDAVICNAGVYGGGRKTIDGVEWTVGVCHVGHFALVTGLLGRLRAAATSSRAARVVMVASESHRTPGTLDLERLWDGRSRLEMVTYGQAKLCNVLFARELDRRERDNGVRAFALHPGTLVATNIGRSSRAARAIMKLASPFSKTVHQAAATSVYCALHPHLEGEGGGYYDSCRPREASREARNDNVAARLWDETERLLSRI
jgi:WW domain-containing oxidoreductase